MHRLLLLTLVATALCCAPKAKAGKDKLVIQERLFEASQDALSAHVYKARGSAGETLRVFIATLDKHALARLHLLPSARPIPLHEVVQKSPALVGINGGFYDAQKPMGLVRAQGKTLAPKKRSGGSGIFLVDKNDQAHVVHRDHYKSAQQRLAVQSIDRIIDAGKSLVGQGANPDKDARSAVVVNKAGDVLLVAVFAEEAIAKETREGENISLRLSAKSSTTGVSLAEFAQLLRLPKIDAESALNLDGGYSTAFFARFASSSYEVIAHRATINALVVNPR